jgi:hypothetical protein
MTCYYRDDEFLEVGQWLYNKFEKLKKEFPESIDWTISENSDMTEGSQQLACTGNNCEL